MYAFSVHVFQNAIAMLVKAKRLLRSPREVARHANPLEVQNICSEGMIKLVAMRAVKNTEAMHEC